jgi:uncharacterized iron-regulated protein
MPVTAPNNAAVIVFAALTSAFVVVLQASGSPGTASPSANGYVPERVYDTQRKAFTDFEVMLADLATADVVLVGEQHDDPNTHRLELAILEGLKRRNAEVIVSLEMFERDVQGPLDAYLAGSASEEDTLKVSRPWPRYRTDYRLLVEMAKGHAWPLIAANVPRRIASAVAKEGREAIEQLPDADRRLVARELECPFDEYFDRFAKSMDDHPGAATQTAEEQRAAIERYYWSQCVKDETMGESIAAGVERRTSSGPVVPYNGSFHSDFSLGTAARVRRRLPGRRIVVLSILPVGSLDRLSPSGEDLQRADYLVYTVK